MHLPVQRGYGQTARKAVCPNASIDPPEEVPYEKSCRGQHSRTELYVNRNEDEAYVCKVASYVDAKIAGLSGGMRISPLDAAVLACTNIADEYFKSLDSLENLRKQLKAYLEDSARSKSEISELRRELARLRKTP
jgi:cell division protein ZapA